jgi:hypothetical protein
MRSAIILTAGLLLLAGCDETSGPSTRSSELRADGTYRASLNAGIADAATATRKGLAKLSSTVTSYSVSPDSGLIIARAPDLSRITIDLQAVTPKETAIAIKIGNVGDPEASEQLFKAIRSSL